MTLFDVIVMLGIVRGELRKMEKAETDEQGFPTDEQDFSVEKTIEKYEKQRKKDRQNAITALLAFIIGLLFMYFCS